MCSQPIVHDAQLCRATWRIAARSSAASWGAPSNVAAWKFLVGSVLIALKASRLASVPSSRYLAVAGPNDRSLRSRAAASTAPGSAGATFAAARTAMALIRLAPSTAPSPPRPACRPSWEIVAYRTPRSPAGPIAATRQPRPSRWRSRVPACAAVSPARSAASWMRAPSASMSKADGVAQAPRITIAS